MQGMQGTHQAPQAPPYRLGMPKSIEDRLDDALAKLDALQERLSPKERGADRINAEIRAAHNSAGSRDRRRLLDRITGRKTHEDQ